MRARAFLSMMFVVLVVGACGKATKDEAKPFEFHYEPAMDEATRLCREAKPCPQGGTNTPFICSLDGQRNNAAVEYAAPGVRIEHLWCRYAKLGEDYVVGVPENGSPHLFNAALFARVRGTARERALAAAELLADHRQLSPDCPIEQHGDALQFCIVHWDRSRHLCTAYPDGTMACSSDGTEVAVDACRRAGIRSVFTATVWSPTVDTSRHPAAWATSIAGNHLKAKDVTGAAANELVASGLRVRQAHCTVMRPWSNRVVYWGEDDAGNIFHGADLIARLDTGVMRAGVAAELIPEDVRDGWFIRDRDDHQLNRRGDPEDCFPPGPVEARGTIVFYTSRGTVHGRSYRRCVVSPSGGTGTCELVTPGSFSC
jgi:hypothetical protein